MAKHNGQVAVSNRGTLCLSALALALLVFLLSGLATAADMSRFQRLVVSLGQAEPAIRGRFARIALLEMAEIHLAEAGLARNQTAQDAEPERLLGWARAVEAYAGQLLRLHEDVEQGAPVLLLPGLVGDTAILVGERSIIISHPRRDQQQALEQAILHVFCGRENCLQLLAARVELAPEPILESPSSRPPSWSFTRSGPVCEQSGLQIQFPAAAGPGAGNLAQYRSLCRQLFAELQLLVAALRSQLRQGVVPEWGALAISATPHRPEHSIRLNSAGDSLLLAVPLLHSTPGLLGHILAWLRPLAESGVAPGLVLQARDLGWFGSPVTPERDSIPSTNP
ncbi:hypothetical protein Q6D67_12930 [Haliea sp. E1-2-M8]|uniref:hypothetical protein n=1 Tax=Haliea sp. E1-2-M8 TaxID=3064706 RepID=UPI0027268941|nr:hypothetical protein [Haliea sp. E1-2-M8]MDO8862607.1 hypothetical protein [Haliea sp. E1-2-M8]